MDTILTKRRNFSDKFKAAVVLEPPRAEKTVQKVAAPVKWPPPVSLSLLVFYKSGDDRYDVKAENLQQLLKF